MAEDSSIGAAYRAMSPEDKAALQELKKQESTRIGKEVSLGDIIRAVTPGQPQPDYLKG